MAFSQKEIDRLKQLHPDLRKVVLRMDAYLPAGFHFSIFEVLRSSARQQELFDAGYSKTLNSKHLKQTDGYSHAVDIIPIKNRKLDWEYKDGFETIAKAMYKAAIELGVQIKWGLLFYDWDDDGHWEM
jgi:peptidoglycan L-alanyl-D-glutamate endopeptidase CwlK